MTKSPQKSGVLIVVGKRPPDLPAPGERSISKRNNAQERPEDEREFHERGGAPKATPESVNFRNMGEGCEQCEYEHGGQCMFLNIPIGLTCNRFEAKTEDQGEREPVEHDMGGYEFEGGEKE